MGGREALEQPDLPRDDLGCLQERARLVHVLGGREPSFLHDKVIGLISAAGGTQGLQAINTMEFATRALRAWAVPYVVPVAAALGCSRNGQVQEPPSGAARDTRQRSVGVARRFVAEDNTVAVPRQFSPKAAAGQRVLQAHRGQPRDSRWDLRESGRSKGWRFLSGHRVSR